MLFLWEIFQSKTRDIMKEIEELVDIIKKTLEKCPWVKEQTINSLKDEPLNEARELKEAIEKKDFQNFEEEIGDLIYDSLLILSIAERDGITTQKKAIEKVIEKIKRRKPWVFGNENVKNSEEAVKRWFEIKNQEKNQK